MPFFLETPELLPAFRTGRRYLAAYAQPLEGGERIWFFPSATGADEPIVEASAEPQVVHQGIKVESLPEGRYEVRVLLGPHPVSREEAVAPLERNIVVQHLSVTVGP